MTAFVCKEVVLKSYFIVACFSILVTAAPSYGQNGNAGVEKCEVYKYNHHAEQDDYNMQKCFQLGNVDGNSDLNKSYGNVWGNSHQSTDFGKPGGALSWYDWYQAWLARHKW